MYYGWRPYVPVAKKLANARKYAQNVAKKEKRGLAPVKSSCRKIATKFWGLAWCENLDHYSDFANRLTRGRRYLGNGSVVDLQIDGGQIRAIVAGSETYCVSIQIRALPIKAWKALRQACSTSIGSLLDLLQGRIDEGVMRRLAQREGGLFPQPREIEMRCNCPDDAYVCKHIAAVIYGVGVRLDESPELLFKLRGVDHSELVTEAVAAGNLEESLVTQSSEFAGSDLGEMFGIELVAGDAASLSSAEGESSTKTARKRPKATAATSTRRSRVAAVPTSAKSNGRTRTKAKVSLKKKG